MVIIVYRIAFSKAQCIFVVYFCEFLSWKSNGLNFLTLKMKFCKRNCICNLLLGHKLVILNFVYCLKMTFPTPSFICQSFFKIETLEVSAFQGLIFVGQHHSSHLLLTSLYLGAVWEGKGIFNTMNFLYWRHFRITAQSKINNFLIENRLFLKKKKGINHKIM